MNFTFHFIHTEDELIFKRDKYLEFSHKKPKERIGWIIWWLLYKRPRHTFSMYLRNWSECSSGLALTHNNPEARGPKFSVRILWKGSD